jgi:hypothetical protein
VTTATRSLDDLDRLGFRLARVIRQQYPQLATQGFTLSDLEERLLPFRETRREMADGGTESWERAMLRLLSGERDIITAEQGLRDACHQALAAASPTMALVRSWSSSLLSLHSPITAAGGEPRAVSRVRSGQGCRYCGGRLPDGRRVTFCPHCGLDLTKRQCPACSTELDVAWRFCVTCGRGADGPETPALVVHAAS